MRTGFQRCAEAPSGVIRVSRQRPDTGAVSVRREAQFRSGPPPRVSSAWDKATALMRGLLYLRAWSRRALSEAPARCGAQGHGTGPCRRSADRAVPGSRYGADEVHRGQDIRARRTGHLHQGDAARFVRHVECRSSSRTGVITGCGGRSIPMVGPPPTLVGPRVISRSRFCPSTTAFWTTTCTTTQRATQSAQISRPCRQDIDTKPMARGPLRKTGPRDSHHLADFHQAPLLWPQNGRDRQWSESDYPEADLNALDFWGIRTTAGPERKTCSMSNPWSRASIPPGGTSTPRPEALGSGPTT